MSLNPREGLNSVLLVADWAAFNGYTEAFNGLIHAARKHFPTCSADLNAAKRQMFQRCFASIKSSFRINVESFLTCLTPLKALKSFCDEEDLDEGVLPGGDEWFNIFRGIIKQAAACKLLRSVDFTVTAGQKLLARDLTVRPDIDLREYTSEIVALFEAVQGYYREDDSVSFAADVKAFTKGLCVTRGGAVSLSPAKIVALLDSLSVQEYRTTSLEFVRDLEIKLIGEPALNPALAKLYNKKSNAIRSMLTPYQLEGVPEQSPDEGVYGGPHKETVHQFDGNRVVTASSVKKRRNSTTTATTTSLDSPLSSPAGIDRLVSLQSPTRERPVTAPAATPTATTTTATGGSAAKSVRSAHSPAPRSASPAHSMGGEGDGDDDDCDNGDAGGCDNVSEAEASPAVTTRRSARYNAASVGAGAAGATATNLSAVIRNFNRKNAASDPLNDIIALGGKGRGKQTRSGKRAVEVTAVESPARRPRGRPPKLARGTAVQECGGEDIEEDDDTAATGSAARTTHGTDSQRDGGSVIRGSSNSGANSGGRVPPIEHTDSSDGGDDDDFLSVHQGSKRHGNSSSSSNNAVRRVTAATSSSSSSSSVGGSSRKKRRSESSVEPAVTVYSSAVKAIGTAIQNLPATQSFPKHLGSPALFSSPSKSMKRNLKEREAAGLGGKRRPRVHWTDEESETLLRAMHVYGTQWAKILQDRRFGPQFNECRTNVDLKDRNAVLRKRPDFVAEVETRIAAEAEGSEQNEQREEEEEEIEEDIEVEED